MSFETNFTNVARGIWKHTPTGMIVHEVFNLEQLVASNGVFVFWDENDTYALAAGRTMAKLMASSNVVLLQDVPQMLNFSVSGLYANSVKAISSSGAGVFQIRPVLSTKQKAVPTGQVRVFALVTNCYDGFKPREVIAATDFATVRVYAPVFIGTSTSYTPEEIGYNGSRVASGIGTTRTVVPHFIARIANSQTKDAYIARLRSQLDHIDKSEVQDWFDGTVTPRLTRLYSCIPCSPAGALSFTPSTLGPRLMSATRLTASTQNRQGMSPWYAPMYRNGSWITVPKPMLSDGVDLLSDSYGAPFSYSGALVGAIGSIPIGHILGGVAGDVIPASSLSAQDVINLSTAGLANLGGDLGMPVQNVGEAGGAYETRVLAAKPTYRTSYANRYVMKPSSDYPGCAGWLIALAGLALNDDAYLGEYLSIIAPYATPSSVLLHGTASPLDTNEGNDNLYLGKNLWATAGELEQYATSMVGVLA